MRRYVMRKGLKRLKNFLRSEKVLTKFRLNCRNCDTGVPLGELCWVSIGTAFVWEETPEGREFWKRLDMKFKVYLRLESIRKSNLAPNLIHALDAEVVHITEQVKDNYIYIK